VAEQDLHGAQVARLLVDDGRLGSAQRIGSVIFPAQSNPGHPLINKSCALWGADSVGVIDPAWKDELVERAAATFEPGKNAAASGLKKFESSLTLGAAEERQAPNTPRPAESRARQRDRAQLQEPPRSPDGPLRSCWVPEGWSQAEHFGRISRVLFIAGHDGYVPNDDFDPDRTFPMKMRFAGIGGIRLARPTANSSPTLDVRGAQRHQGTVRKIVALQ
jgi:hypothetical protein